MNRLLKYIVVVSLFLVLTACGNGNTQDQNCEVNNEDFATTENNPLGFMFNYSNSTEEIDYTNLFLNENMNEYVIDDSNIDLSNPDTYEVQVKKESCSTAFSFDITIYPTLVMNTNYYVEMGSSIELDRLVLNYVVLTNNAYELSVDTTNFNSNAQGAYDVDVSIIFNGEVLATQPVEVQVMDSEAPIISLKVDRVVIEQGYDIDLEGYLYNVTDNVSRRLIDKVRIGDKSFSNIIPGDYEIVYSVEDDEGNLGTATLSVTVLPSVRPTITLNGPTTVFVKIGTEYTESEDLISYDDYRPENENDYIGDVFYHRMGDVDTSEVGIYDIEYKVTDTAEQTASVYRRVVVYDDLNFLDSQLFGGNGGVEEITKTVTLSDGSVIAIGYTSVGQNSSLVNPGDVSTYYTYPRTAFIAKFNEINEIEWIHIINSHEETVYPHYSLLSDVMVDEDDNIYAIGSYHGVYDENTASIQVDVSYITHIAVTDMFVTKLTKDGLEEYTTLHGSSEPDFLYSGDLAVVNGELMIYAYGYSGAEDYDFEDDDLENDTYGKGFFSFTASDGMIKEFQVLEDQVLKINDLLINPNNNQLIIVGAYWDYPLLMQASTNLFDQNYVIKYFEDIEEGEFNSLIVDENTGDYIALGYTDILDILWESEYNYVQSGYVVRFNYNPNGIGDENKFDILNQVILRGWSETQSVVNESWIADATFDEFGNLYVVGTTSNAYDENGNYISMGGLQEYSESEGRVVFSNQDGFMAIVDLDNETYEYVERYGATYIDNLNAIEIIGNRIFLAGKTSANNNTEHLGNVQQEVKDDLGYDILIYNKIDITKMVADMLVEEESFTYYGTQENIDELVNSLNEYFALDTDFTVEVSNNQLVLLDDSVEVYTVDIVVQ